jgi:hypothetical protein
MWAFTEGELREDALLFLRDEQVGGGGEGTKGEGVKGWFLATRFISYELKSWFQFLFPRPDASLAEELEWTLGD